MCLVVSVSLGVDEVGGDARMLPWRYNVNVQPTQPVATTLHPPS